MKPCDRVKQESTLTATPLLTVLLALTLCIWGCSEERRSYVENPGADSPTMISDSVETFISDSGYTRYHIKAPSWHMYDEADEPYWKFPKGIELQTYDMALRPESFLYCDSAIYWTRLRRWRLDGHVEMLNTAKDSFLTNQLFYDDADSKVYTDSFIHIVKSDRILEGYGFISNREMTSYSITHPTAILPVSTLKGDEKPSPAEQIDTLAPQPAPRGRRAPLPTRASKRNNGVLPYVQQ